MVNSAEHGILTAHKYRKPKLMEFARLNNTNQLFILLINEPRREKTGFLHMRKQRSRSASR